MPNSWLVLRRPCVDVDAAQEAGMTTGQFRGNLSMSLSAPESWT